MNEHECDHGCVWPKGDPRRCAKPATKVYQGPDLASYACDEHAAELPMVAWEAVPSEEDDPSMTLGEWVMFGPRPEAPRG